MRDEAFATLVCEYEPAAIYIWSPYTGGRAAPFIDDGRAACVTGAATTVVSGTSSDANFPIMEHSQALK